MKVGAFGEVMLRLSTQNYLLLQQSNALNIDFTGSGLNLLASLSQFGLEVSLLTTLPENRLGFAAKSKLKGYGINTRFITHKNNHMGSYIAELGFGNRPTHVTYQNRLNSSFGLSRPEDYCFDEFVENVDLVHICGISLSLTDNIWHSVLELAKLAKQKEKKVFFDFNFRPSLSKKNEMQKIIQRYKIILPYCDYVFGSKKDIAQLLDMKSIGQSDEINLVRIFLDEYDILSFSGTKRIYRDNCHYIAGQIVTKSNYYSTKFKKLTTLDRIGTGDAFAAGILFAHINKWDIKMAAEFSVANSILAHTLLGDVPLNTIEDVMQILADESVDLIR